MTHNAAPLTLVIGAGSTIARALIEHRLAAGATVVSVSRQAHAEQAVSRHLRCDYSPVAIAETAAMLGDLAGRLQSVFICHGVLHAEHVKPEKRLEDIDANAMLHVLQANTVVPALWLRHLLPLLRKAPHCVLTVFSARVGSISDNRKGGWYSYRASKAGLNMVLKTAAIEYARRAPGVKLCALHPGTVDTPLSAPFQQHVPAQQLQQPEAVAARLLALTDDLRADGELAYLDWQGKPIAW